MTHEPHPGTEHGGPEHDDSLPAAEQIPGDLSPEESDLPPLEGDL